MNAAEILHAVNSRTGVGEEMFALPEAYDITEAGELVSPGDVRARYVLGGKGSRIPLSVARALGLTDTPKTAEAAEEKAVAPQADKAERPAANKRLFPSAGKRATHKR